MRVAGQLCPQAGAFSPEVGLISLFSLNSCPVMHGRSLNSVDFLCNVLHSSDGRKTDLPENSRGASGGNTPVLLG